MSSAPTHAILEVCGLQVAYTKEGTPALRDVSFSISSNDFTALLGPNGGGKTTLIRAILGLVPLSGGEIVFRGEPLRKANRRLIGYVPQAHHFPDSYPMLTDELLATAFVDSLRPFLRLSSDERKKRDVLLDQLQITHLSGKPVSSLSGGELKRVLIARALLTQPLLLLLDEPMAHLDPKGREELYAILKGISKDTSILMATHDIRFLSKHFTNILFLHQSILYAGKPKEGKHILKEFSKKWIF